MYVRRLKVQNVRGFRELALDFHRPDGSLAGWTVLAGRNGSGKSSLLRIIAAVAVGPSRAQALTPSIADWLRRGQEQGSAQLDLEFSKQDFPRSPIPHEQAAPRLEWRGDPERGTSFGGRTGSGWDFNWGLWQGGGLEGGLLAGYGPYRRLTGHAADVQNLMTSHETIARVVSLFREDASLVECVSWLREVYLRRLENKPGAAELEHAVLSLLNDGLLPDGVLVEKVDSEGLWVSQKGVRLPLNELSDGYRTTAALVMDIVRHLQSYYGDLNLEEDEEAGGRCYRVLLEGVVLIDEVDLHLHVSWQKRIGFWLKRHFPKIQFIVTTHSPFVCQAADPGGLIRLPAPGEDRPVEHVSESLYNTVVNGSIDDAVLTELFGLETPYSQEAERLRERVAELEAKVQTGKVSAKEKSELRNLRSRLPKTMSSDVEQALRKLASEG